MEDNKQTALSKDENNVSKPVDKGSDNAGTSPVGSELSATEGKKATDNTEGEGEDTAEQISMEEYRNLENSYKEAERKITELGQDRSHIKSQFDAVTGAITKLQEQLAIATKKPPPNPEQLIRDIESKGIEALKPFIEEPVNMLKTQHSKELEDIKGENLELQVQVARIIREGDPTNYPSFKKFWPEIQTLAQDPNTPVDFSKGVDVVMDALYKLTQTKHSKEAILEAEKLAKEKAESGLANESDTTVAGGGKKVGKTTPDLSKIKDIKKLREVVAQMHGVADQPYDR